MANALRFRQIKRTGFSLLLGFGFTIVYTVLMIVITGIELFSSGYEEILGLPVIFVYYIYKSLGGDDSSEFVGNHVILFLFSIFTPPALFYSAIAYFLLALIAKHRKSDSSDNLPPLPPEKFD